MTHGSGDMLDVLVVGAGPAGIGTALALAAVDGLHLCVMERGEVGQTFVEWPERQTFLTPSFTTNGFGGADLNAIHPVTSPAYSLGVDYLDGAQYARYLRGTATHFGVPVVTGREVTAVRPVEPGRRRIGRRRSPGTFEVDTSHGTVRARTVVWAGGEFHDPVVPPLPGADHVDHSRSAAAWEPRHGHVVVIGGYESGMDIAHHHLNEGASVTMVDGASPWDAGTGSDPSFRLAPRSRMRLEAARATGRLTLAAAHALAVEDVPGGFAVVLDDGTRLHSHSRPVAATGFGPGLGPVGHLFARRPDGWPELDANDESTTTPGLFLSGPAMRHEGLKFCFVYKFRLRFAHVAGVIGRRLGKDCSALEDWRAAGMLVDDLECCGAECAC